MGEVKDATRSWQVLRFARGDFNTIQFASEKLNRSWTTTSNSVDVRGNFLLLSH